MDSLKVSGTDPVGLNTFDLYELALQISRREFSCSDVVEQVTGVQISAKELLGFLICFNALGVKMTEQVEDWIYRAGLQCEQLGLAKLGVTLKLHSKHEAGHEQLMVRDTYSLVTQWNLVYQPRLQAEELLNFACPTEVFHYIELHERIIAGNTPYAQLAVEYEIERLSVDFGAFFIRHCQQLLGPAVMAGLSFVQEHASIDVGHTNLNQRQLEELLREHPDYLSVLTEAGQQALETYRAFLEGTLRLSRNLA